MIFTYGEHFNVVFKFEDGAEFFDILVHNGIHDMVQQFQDENLPLFQICERTFNKL